MGSIKSCVALEDRTRIDANIKWAEAHVYGQHVEAVGSRERGLRKCQEEDQRVRGEEAGWLLKSQKMMIGEDNAKRHY